METPVLCKVCGNSYPSARKMLGYSRCIPCAEKSPEKITRTIVPLHKSNYVVITDKSLLPGINIKAR